MSGSMREGLVARLWVGFPSKLLALTDRFLGAALEIITS